MSTFNVLSCKLLLYSAKNLRYPCWWGHKIQNVRVRKQTVNFPEVSQSNGSSRLVTKTVGMIRIMISFEFREKSKEVRLSRKRRHSGQRNFQFK